MESTLIHIKLNGKDHSIASGTSVLSLLKSQNVNPHVVACELNLKILKRNELDQVTFHEGDELEVLQMIGGG